MTRAKGKAEGKVEALPLTFSETHSLLRTTQRRRNAPRSSNLPLVTSKAPAGKFRVVADNYGKWAETHEDILVGDFDTLKEARAAQAVYFAKPYWEHWTCAVWNDEGKSI